MYSLEKIPGRIYLILLRKMSDKGEAIRMDIDEMIEQLLDMDIVGDSNTVTFSDEAKQLIHEIAEKCNSIPLVNKTKEQAERYGEGMTAEQIYVDMLCKIVEAPTRMLMRMVVRMLIPVIDKKLTEGGV